MKKNKLAIFDIDGTVFRSNLVIELVDELIKNKIFPEELALEIEKDYTAWANRQASFTNYTSKVVNVYRANIKGVTEEELKKVIKEIVDYQKDKLYVFTRELIKRLKKENYYLLAISGSPEIIVSEFANALGFDMYYGSRFEAFDGVYTGKQIGDIARNKNEILNSFIAKHKEFDLKTSVGIGDSEIDIAFLDLVGEPIAFNPDLGLAEHAKKNKWRIIVERKNVVYDIKDFGFELTS